MVVLNRGNDVVMYDAERNEWTTKELSTEDPFAQFSEIDFSIDCLHEDGLFFMPRAQVGTFHVEECNAEEEDSKHLKLGKSWFRVTDKKFKDIVLLSSSHEVAFPYECCSTT
ncbi:hypothetical protein V6N13_036782 [Hibiscus sabdariffa]|uniref:F-box protein n=1 Tax=Hibiscus sabdariffa TaxID=183260 RepID=A0ABR2S5D1_9ROSI